MQKSVQALQKSQITKEDEEEEELLDPQPFLEVIWGDQVLEDFKPPYLSSFDGKSNLREHIISINNQMEIVGDSDFLNASLLRECSKMWHFAAT